MREAQRHVEGLTRLYARHRRHQLSLDRTFAHGCGMKDDQTEETGRQGAK
jgi:hypothetical protein